MSMFQSFRIVLRQFDGHLACRNTAVNDLQRSSYAGPSHTCSKSVKDKKKVKMFIELNM